MSECAYCYEMHECSEREGVMCCQWCAEYLDYCVLPDQEHPEPDKSNTFFIELKFKDKGEIK